MSFFNFCAWGVTPYHALPNPRALGPKEIPKSPGIMLGPHPQLTVVIRGQGVPKTRGLHIIATPCSITSITQLINIISIILRTNISLLPSLWNITPLPSLLALPPLPSLLTHTSVYPAYQQHSITQLIYYQHYSMYYPTYSRLPSLYTRLTNHTSTTRLTNIIFYYISI